MIHITNPFLKAVYMTSNEADESVNSEISYTFTYYLTEFSCLLKQPSFRGKNNISRITERRIEQKKNRIKDLQKKLSVVISREDFPDAVPTLSYIINNAKPGLYQNNFDIFIETYELLIIAVTSDQRYQIWLNTNEAILRHSPPLFDRLSHQIMYEQLETNQLMGDTSTLKRKL